jgi:hypothetical protein
MHFMSHEYTDIDDTRTSQFQLFTAMPSRELRLRDILFCLYHASMT